MSYLTPKHELVLTQEEKDSLRRQPIWKDSNEIVQLIINSAIIEKCQKSKTQ